MTTCSVTSLLHDLQPLFGLTITFNLAYIALPRFRYRDNVRRAAGEGLSRLSDKVPDKTKKNAQWYKHVAWLAGKKLADPETKRQKVIGEHPNVSWAKQYRILFASQADRYITGFLSFIFSVIIAISVAQKICYLTSLFGPTTVETIHLYYWCAVVCCFVPVLLVWRGTRYVQCAQEYADQVVDDYLVDQSPTSESVNVRPSTAPNQ